METEQFNESYWCIYCQREIRPEVHDGGNLYIHDDVEHPATFTQRDEKIEH